MKLSSMIYAAFAASALFVMTTTSALAANNFTCWEFVAWKDSVHTGFNPIEPPMVGVSADYTGNPPSATTGIPVSGSTISAAASDCHGKTEASFLAAKAFSDPDQVCVSENNGGRPDQYGRTFHGAVTVWAIDRFKEIAETPQLYNRVDSYVVDCTKKGNAAHWVHGLVGGVRPF